MLNKHIEPEKRMS